MAVRPVPLELTTYEVFSSAVYVPAIRYILDRQYILGVVNKSLRFMIVPRLDKLLANENRSFYWLAKETGVSHTTLWRLKKGKAVGINFDTLEKICRALSCLPGDVLFLTGDNNLPKPQSLKTKRKSLR